MNGNLQKYKSKNIIQKMLINKFLYNIFRLISLTEAESILDLGCGEGFVIRYLRNHNNNLRFEGLDINEEAINIAKKLNPDVNFVICNLYKPQYNENSFDLVMLTEVLEHLEDPEKVMNVIEKISNKHFILSVPWEPIFSIGNLLRGRNILKWGNDPEHINKWGRDKFVTFVNNHFFVTRVVSSFPWTIVLCEK
jgi:2-polyprenyl-3-methyl-5-hydroxy-6-metoxy-1,4-benzoquinol methylase